MVRAGSVSSKNTAGTWTKRNNRKLHLSLVVCGASGTGKTSFINTLVGRQVSDPHSPDTTAYGPDLKPFVIDVEEDNGMHIVLNVLDTPGFATGIDVEADIENLANYIECRFDEVLAEESRIRRNPRFKDNRVDVCLYFIEPTGHGLRELDLLALRRLTPIVNVIPVLGRADQLTPSERLANKRMTMEDINLHDIKLFDFVDEEGDPEYEDNELNALLRDLLPLAITSSSEFDISGQCQYRRKLAYGEVNVLDPDHTDFSLIRQTLFETHLDDLRDRTRDVIYEAYRTARLDPRKNHRNSLLLPQELAEHAARLKEAQLLRESRYLREQEMRISAEIQNKRLLLQQRENELRQVEMQMRMGPSAQVGGTSDHGSTSKLETSTDASSPESVLPNSKSQQLQQHADQLHAEVATLEAQRNSVQQRQLATATSSLSLHGKLQGNPDHPHAEHSKYPQVLQPHPHPQPHPQPQPQPQPQIQQPAPSQQQQHQVPEQQSSQQVPQHPLQHSANQTTDTHNHQPVWLLQAEAEAEVANEHRKQPPPVPVARPVVDNDDMLNVGRPLSFTQETSPLHIKKTVGQTS